MNIRITEVILVSVFITACGATKLSTNELYEVNSGKKAILQTYKQPLIEDMIFAEQPVTKIISVDGKNIDSEYF